ncbi:MAG: hypothetical protein E3I52_05620 [Candidatus Aminicenantes bacterium]|nr:MAG: hypothetical protein E3I52_05620 [Candidatus Aminicenantes bacterium]
MKLKSQYSSAKTNACFSIIVELMTYLKKYSHNIVLVGGWVPYFLYGDIKEEEQKHVGSLDVDLALNFLLIPEQDYQTIADILEERGYKNRKDRKGNIIHASYERTFADESNNEQIIQVDFLASEYGGSSKNKRHQRIQDMLARKGRGVDLVFESCVERELEANMPNGARNKIKLKIANLYSIIATKSFAFYERRSEKDAYDIYWLFKNHPKGEAGVIKELSRMKNNKLFIQALNLIKESFKNLDSLGPVAVANFFEPSEAEEREIIQRDSYETINRIMKYLKI